MNSTAFLRFFLLLLLSAPLTAQEKRGWNWAIGDFKRLSYNGSTVAFSSSAMDSFEGSATISDTAGLLLFYTDGVTVWNAAGTIMPNGTGLASDPSSTCAAVIIPAPANDSIYYIFTVDAYAGHFNSDGAARYSIVNMHADSGRGDVIVKNVFLYTPTTEKLCAVKHANGRDYWVMTHDFNSNTFRAFLVDSTGVSSSPVLSSCGAVHSFSGPGDYGQNSVGGMKFSPSGHMLALVVMNLNLAEIFSFDKTTGIVSLPFNFGYVNWPYDICFSPDNTKLYISENSGLVQYDLSLPLFSDIQLSKTSLGNPGYGIQVGPDEKVYVICHTLGRLDQILYPNLAGTACTFGTPRNMNAEYGLPNFVQDFLPGDTNVVTWSGSPEAINEISRDKFAVFPNPAHEKTSIAYPGNTPRAINLCDVHGRIVWSVNQPAENETVVDLSALPNGMYVVTLLFDTGESHRQLIVQHNQD